MSNKLDLYQVLEEEYKERHKDQPDLPKDYLERREEIQGKGLSPEALNQALVAEMYKVVHKEKPSALCISGGGIRSATFGLGVLQGLARNNLLGCFDYLSTVSGGGYIGSWLTAWIYRQTPQVVINALRNAQPACALKPEPEQIGNLRDYSNYMTPQLGLLSADTWTLVATYFRNLILNWLILLPLFFAVLCLPRISVAVVQLTLKPDSWLPEVVLSVGFILAVAAVAYICLNLPSAREMRQAPAKFPDRRDHQSNFLWCCLLPLVLAAILLTSYWAWFRNRGGEVDLTSFLLFLFFGASLHFLGWVPYVFKVRSWKLLREAIGVIGSGAFGGLAAWIVATKFFANPQAIAEYYSSFAMPALLLVYLLAGILYVGITSRSTTDEDREWWGRSSAWILLVLLGWASLSSLVVFGPVGLGYLPALLSISGVVSGLVTLILGFSSKTPANKKDEERGGRPATARKWALRVALPFFVLFLVVILSLASDFVINTVLKAIGRVMNLVGIDWKSIGSLPDVSSGHRHIISNTPWDLLVTFWLAMLVLSLCASRFVNVNKFSLHAIYRNRLIRAYLGASNQVRKPNPFTGLAPDDNLAMNLLRQKPLHVVNIALNLVHGSKLAWQERKAESFTVTPLHAGNYELGYRPVGDYGVGHYGKNKKPEPISLGTAMAISGAAASPNMGYHSSPVVTFLLALFNVRLGWWLGNPGKYGESTFHRSSPRFAIRPILAEAFGLTNDRHPYIYLSDGGHFENLGLYEMILRRCHFLLVSDAGCDPDSAFEDLGNAIRKIRIDLGVKIELTCFKNILPRSEKEFGKCGKELGNCYCAMGNIIYSAVDPGAPPGVLIYVKPVLSGTEPVDVYNYSRVSREFPHESTGDQWFSESQFESYRMLGLHIVEQISGGGVAPTPGDPGDAFVPFERQIHEYLARCKPDSN